MTEDYHIPVLLKEAVEALNVRPDGVYVDATFGGGGHSRAVMERLGERGHLYAFDQDADAAQRAEGSEWKMQWEGRFTFIGENFRHMKSFLRMHGVRQVDGVLADLGVSSHQFDTPERGFSTRFDGELDMRMDRRNPLTARTVVNTYGEEELARVLRLYGELPNARQMAGAIAKARTEAELVTTGDLKRAVGRHLPRGVENKYLAMLFQALRIEVGGELDALREMLQGAASLLPEGGRLVVISYHSLEDRIVKNFFRSGNFDGEVEKDFYGNVLSPLKPVLKCRAGEAEVAANSRARSAMMRVAERVRPEGNE